MAQPTTRAEFKEFCLRALGKPVIEINVDDDQVDDRVDQSLRFYYDYHFDGTEKVYYKHLVDANTVANMYIDLPENIIGAVKMFPMDSISTSSGDIFNIRYQIALNDLYTLTNVALIDYYMTMEHLAMVQEVLVGKPQIRYNRHRNRLHIDETKGDLVQGKYILIEAYEIVDPATYSDVWSDRWLQNYTTQQIKRQWGTNLTKFEGLQLPGGVTFNGIKIYDDADAEIKRLEEEMITNYSLPVMDMIG
jgi:hypothetical protein